MRKRLKEAEGRKAWRMGSIPKVSRSKWNGTSSGISRDDILFGKQYV
jgi:hypothetical protein